MITVLSWLLLLFFVERVSIAHQQRLVMKVDSLELKGTKMEISILSVVADLFELSAHMVRRAGNLENSMERERSLLTKKSRDRHEL